LIYDIVLSFLNHRISWGWKFTLY